MTMMLVNGYLAYKYVSEEEMTLVDITNRVAVAMCAKEVEEAGASVATSTYGSRQALTAALEKRMDPGDIPHTPFNG